MNTTLWIVIIILSILVLTLLRVLIRGYFWKDKYGNKLNIKQFFKRFLMGIEGITPLQQTRTTLISFLPMFAGITFGIVVTIIGKTYWITLILCGSLPITTIQFISHIQKYIAQKRVQKTLEELNKIEKKWKKKNKTIK